MISFTVHEPPNAPADRLDRAEALVFVADGFSLIATLLTPLWLIMQSCWRALAIYLIVLVGSSALLVAFDAPDKWLVIVSGIIHLVAGFEADEIRRWELGLSGWRMVGTVSGRNRPECERRFFDGWLPTQPFLARNSTTSGIAAPGTMSAAVGVLESRSIGGGRGWRSIFKRGQ